MLNAYTIIDLKPSLPPHDASGLYLFRIILSALAILLPAGSSIYYLRPVFDWIRGLGASEADSDKTNAPEEAVIRGGNAPLALAVFCLMTWAFLDVLFFFRIWTIFPTITLGMVVHFFGLPILAGLISAATIYFFAEAICRTFVWPLLFEKMPIEENPRLRKVRVVHRLFLQMIAICFLPLGAVVFTALIRMDRLLAADDPILFRVIMVIILIGVSASLGGAWLAWAVAHSMSRALRTLETAMAQLRGGDFSVRVRASATDEIGALEEGFNHTAKRLSESYEALEERNRELAEALERVDFLEKVKRGLDRFVPDTVSRLVEENPDDPNLEKMAKDITVLFLDIEGYTRLSESIPREQLNELIERYFSLFISDIHDENGDINETAGDGLMILFQGENPDEHASSAVRAALAIAEKTEAANNSVDDARRAHPPIQVNIGIGSGVCHVGSTRIKGAAGERWTYTATGPVTNIGARLCGSATRGQIFLSPETAERVSGRFRIEKIGPLELKNVGNQIEAWEVKPDRRKLAR
jgi:class 3 adenylate cyclase